MSDRRDVESAGQASRGREPAGLNVPVDPGERRTWFLTWATYGSWLPGDHRGFTGAIRDGAGRKMTTRDLDAASHLPNPNLHASARAAQRGETIAFARRHAEVVSIDIRRSCDYRGWHLSASAVMPFHVHGVVTVCGDPDPEAMIRDLKSYASRALNRAFGRPPASWWARGASKRVLRSEQELMSVVRYVRDQPDQLVVDLDREFLAD